MELQRVGYWYDDGVNWPWPHDLVDASWASEERDLVADHLKRGFVARVWMGYAKCRMCGVTLGDKDLTDGVFVWPEGLDHYLTNHAVRLPDWFVDHVRDCEIRYADATFTDTRWKKTKGH